MSTGSQDIPFITKLIPPRRRTEIVPRSRLVTALIANLDKRVQLISAPAGYGKTSLLTEFADHADYPVCWYTVTSEDRDPKAFLGYCIRSIERQVGPLGVLESRLVRHVSAGDWRRLLGDLVTALQLRLTGKLLLIFDDLHQMDASQEVREALSLFIERAPDMVRFILGSRTRPSLSCIPRLMIQGEINAIDFRDLRFSKDETTALLSTIWQRSVDDTEAQAIIDRASGWAAGISLLARADKAGEKLDERSEWLDTALFDYLAEEVFHKLPETHQTFLLQTSILQEFTPDICNELLDRSDSQQILTQLCDTGYFIEERASHESTYRYHDLFREYLERTLERDRSESYRALHRKAAALAEQQGNDGRAITHLVAAGDLADAAGLIKRLAQSYVERGKWQTLHVWLSLLPPLAVDQDAELLLLRAMAQLHQGEVIESVECVNHAMAICNNKVTLGRALVTKSAASRLLGHLDTAVETAQQGITTLRDANATSHDVAEAYRQLASARATRGEFADAHQDFELALSLVPEEDLQLHNLICDGLGGVHLELGQLDTAAVHLEKARQGWFKLSNERALAETLNNLALVYYYKGEFDIALDELGEAEKAASAAGYQRVYATAVINRGMVQRARKDYDKALESFTTGLQMAREILDHRLVAEATNGLGNTFWRAGQPDKAETLLRQAIIEMEQSGQKYLMACYSLSLGKVHSREGALREAMDCLDLAETVFCEQGSSRGVAEAKLHQAAALYRMDRTRDALARMGDLAQLLEQLGYEGFLLPDGDQAVDILRLSLAKGIGGGRFKSLVRRLEGEPERGDTSTGAATGRVLPTVRVTGFGHAQVFVDRHQVGDNEWRSRKAKELLFFLLCNKRPASKEQLIEALWPDSADGEHEDALRMNIHRLRQAVYRECVNSVEDGYAINPDVPVEFDVEQFSRLVEEATRHQSGTVVRRKKLEEAVQLYRGPFLEEVYSDWCEFLRRDLDLKYIRALSELAWHCVAKGEPARAVALVEKIAESDLYDEEVNILLARGYLQLGDPLSALHGMRSYMRRVREELQAEPSQEFLELYYDTVRQGPAAGAAAR